MKIGGDTGFFIALIEDAPIAQKYWQEVVNGESDLI